MDALGKNAKSTQGIDMDEDKIASMCIEEDIQCLLMPILRMYGDWDNHWDELVLSLEWALDVAKRKGNKKAPNQSQ